MRSLSLTRSSRGAADVHLGPPGSSAPSAASAGSSSMSPGTSSGSIAKLAAARRSDTRMRAHRLAARPRSRPSTSTLRAGAAQDVEQRGPRRVQADALDLDVGRRACPAAAATQNAADETSPGHRRASRAAQALAAARPRSRRRRRVARARRTRGAPARCDRASRAGSTHRRRALGLQAGEQDGALHLRARHLRCVGDAVQAAAVDRQRRPAVDRRRCARPCAVSGSMTRRIGRRRQRGVAADDRAGTGGRPGCPPAAASSCRSCRRRAVAAGARRPPQAAARRCVTASGGRVVRSATPSARRQARVAAQSAPGDVAADAGSRRRRAPPSMRVAMRDRLVAGDRTRPAAVPRRTRARRRARTHVRTIASQCSTGIRRTMLALACIRA